MDGLQIKNPITGMLNGKLLFLKEFLKHPRQIGSIIPSSRFLEQRIVSTGRIASARVVVELGPGTGGTTRALLRAMSDSARLLSIELNPRFHALVSGVDDHRLIPHLGSACDLESILTLHQLEAPDVVVSGIPFSTMDLDAAKSVLSAVSTTLAQDGRFLAYQVSDRVATLCRPFLGSERSAVELLNIPPMRVYVWQKSPA